MAYNPQDAIKAAAAKTPNMNEAQKGGGDRVIAPEGPARLRLIGYVETGSHASTYLGVEKVRNKVELIFELSGPNHKPQEFDGVKVPFRISVKENLFLNEKANFFKLFKAMNYTGEATHMAQLLGEDFLGTVYHSTFKNSAGKEVTFATLKGPNGYNIGKPYFTNPETGEEKRITADPAISEQRLFLWDFPSKEMWDALYIDGQWDDGGSKNVFQDKIKAALNYQGSPIDLILQGLSDDLPDVESEAEPEEPKPKAKIAAAKTKGKASDDDLNI